VSGYPATGLTRQWVGMPSKGEKVKKPVGSRSRQLSCSELTDGHKALMKVKAEHLTPADLQQQIKCEGDSNKSTGMMSPLMQYFLLEITRTIDHGRQSGEEM